MKYRKKTKAQRRRWWRNLSDAQREHFIKRKQAQKAKRRVASGYVRAVTGFEKTGVDASNRDDYYELIGRMNPWLDIEDITDGRCNKA